MCLLIVLQSWAQGCAAWGEPGMKKLWGASNLRIYGGGVADTEFLRSLSELVGDHEQIRRSIHNGQAGSSTGTTWQRERVLDTATLGALPKGTALVLLSGARPVVVRSSPWWEGPAAEAVRASIARYDPTAAAGTR
jgi:type IV secretory pathway TraG/TraD family ATPase VirD4